MNQRLKDLPGFDDAARSLAKVFPELDVALLLSDVTDIVIPGLRRIIDHESLFTLARTLGNVKFQAIEHAARCAAARRCIRLVPPPLPAAANDCEAQ